MTNKTAVFLASTMWRLFNAAMGVAVAWMTLYNTVPFTPGKILFAVVGVGFGLGILLWAGISQTSATERMMNTNTVIAIPDGVGGICYAEVKDVLDPVYERKLQLEKEIRQKKKELRKAKAEDRERQREEMIARKTVV